MEKRVKIYSNKKLFISQIVLMLAMLTAFIVIMYGITYGFTTRSLLVGDAAIALGGFAITLSIFCAACILSGNDAHMIFTKEGVEFRRWFKKTEFHPYKDYPYVEKAWHLYYGMPQYYIVLSNFRLPEKYRSAINWSKSSSEFIKIRYKKKEYEALLSIVPPRIASTIRAKFSDVPFGKLDFLLF